MDQAATTTPATTPAATKAAEPLDLAKLTAEIEALADLAGAAANGGVSPSGEVPVERGAAATASSGTGSTDFAALEREIEALLAGGTAPAAQTPAPAEPAASQEVQELQELQELQSALDEHLGGQPAQVAENAAPDMAANASSEAPSDVRSNALVAKSIDPLMQEIDSLLADDADALLANSGGDIGRAVESVFDPRALNSQEEDINRAMIDAFGSSRTSAFSFGDAVVTNPAPRFDGVSKEVPPDMPRMDHERAAREKAAAAPARSFEAIASESMARTKSEYAGEKPFEPAFPALPVETNDPRLAVVPSVAAAPASEPVAAAPAVVAAPSPVATATLNPQPAPAPAARAATPKTEPAVVAAEPVASGPSAIARAFRAMGRMSVAIVSLPLVACALPMRFVPTSARGIVSVAAITTVLWVPVAWWYATSLAKKPGVGPVALVERAATEGDAADAKPADDAKPAESH